MSRESSAICSVNSVSDGVIHSLVVVADDRYDISLLYFGNSSSLPAHCSPETSFRLLSRWHGGDYDDQSGRALGISCLSALDGLTVTIVYTNNQGTYCRKLMYGNNFLESTHEDLLEFTHLASDCRNSVPNAKTLVILQKSHMVVLVLDDDSLLISTGVGGIPLTTIDPVIGSDAVCGSTSSNKLKLKTLDCHKLPTLSTSNKAYRSLHSDEIIIGQIYAREFPESIVLVFLIESKYTGLMSLVWTQLEFSEKNSQTCNGADIFDFDFLKHITLKILYEVSLMSEKAIIQMPQDIISLSRSGSRIESNISQCLFVAVSDSVQIFGENGLVRKISLDSSVCGFTVMKNDKFSCKILTSCHSGEYQLHEVQYLNKDGIIVNECVPNENVPNENVPNEYVPNENVLDSKGSDHYDFSSGHSYRNILFTAAHDQYSSFCRSFLPFCESMLYLPSKEFSVDGIAVGTKKNGSEDQSVKVTSPQEHSSIKMLGYHPHFGFQYLQSVDCMSGDTCVLNQGIGNNRIQKLQDRTEMNKSGTFCLNIKNEERSNFTTRYLGPFQCSNSRPLDVDRVSGCHIIQNLRVNPGMSHCTPERLIAVCGNTAFKKEETNTSAEKGRRVEGKCNGVIDENINTILRMDSGLTLSTEQRILLDIGEDNPNRKESSNDVLDITKRSRIFSFTFSALKTTSNASESDQISGCSYPNEAHTVTSLAVLLSSRIAKVSSLTIVQLTGGASVWSTTQPAIIETEETLAWFPLHASDSYDSSPRERKKEKEKDSNRERERECSKRPLKSGISQVQVPGLAHSDGIVYALQVTPTRLAVVRLSSRSELDVDIPPEIISLQSIFAQKVASGKVKIKREERDCQAVGSWRVQIAVMVSSYLVLTLTSQGEHYMAVLKITPFNDPAAGRPIIEALCVVASLPIASMTACLKPYCKGDEGVGLCVDPVVLVMVTYWDEEREKEDEKERGGKDEKKVEMDSIVHIFQLQQLSGLFMLTPIILAVTPDLNTATTRNAHSIVRHLYAFPNLVDDMWGYGGGSNEGTEVTGSLCIVGVTGDGLVLFCYYVFSPPPPPVHKEHEDSGPHNSGVTNVTCTVSHVHTVDTSCGVVLEVSHVAHTPPHTHQSHQKQEQEYHEEYQGEERSHCGGLMLTGSEAVYLLVPYRADSTDSPQSHSDKNTSFSPNFSSYRDTDPSDAVLDNKSHHSVSWKFEEIACDAGEIHHFSPFTKPSGTQTQRVKKDRSENCFQSTGVEQEGKRVSVRGDTHDMKEGVGCGGMGQKGLKGINCNPLQTNTETEVVTETQVLLEQSAFTWIQQIRGSQHTTQSLTPLTAETAESTQLALCIGTLKTRERPHVNVFTYVPGIVRTLLLSPDKLKCIVHWQSSVGLNSREWGDVAKSNHTTFNTSDTGISFPVRTDHVVSNHITVYDSSTLQQLWSSGTVPSSNLNHAVGPDKASTTVVEERSSTNAALHAALHSTVGISAAVLPDMVSQFTAMSGCDLHTSLFIRNLTVFGHFFSIGRGNQTGEGMSLNTTHFPSSSSSSAAAATATARDNNNDSNDIINNNDNNINNNDNYNGDVTATAIAIWGINITNPIPPPSYPLTSEVPTYHSQSTESTDPKSLEDSVILLGCCEVPGGIVQFQPLGENKLASLTSLGVLHVCGWVELSSADDGDDDGVCDGSDTREKINDSSEMGRVKAKKGLGLGGKKKTEKEMKTGNENAKEKGKGKGDCATRMILRTLCSLHLEVDVSIVVAMVCHGDDTVVLSLATGAICLFYYTSLHNMYRDESVDSYQRESDAKHHHNGEVGRDESSGSIGIPQKIADNGKTDFTHSIIRGSAFSLPSFLFTDISIRSSLDSTAMKMFCMERMTPSLAVIEMDNSISGSTMNTHRKILKLSVALIPQSNLVIFDPKQMESPIRNTNREQQHSPQFDKSTQLSQSESPSNPNNLEESNSSASSSSTLHKYNHFNLDNFYKCFPHRDLESFTLLDRNCAPFHFSLKSLLSSTFEVPAMQQQSSHV